jgi:hypothetical protein
MIIPREANLVRFYVQLQTSEGGKVVSIGELRIQYMLYRT